MKTCCDITLERTAIKRSDEELVRFFTGGNEWAFRELMERYSKKMLNYINRIIYDRERAEDILQETFLRVYRYIDRFDTTRRFSPWVYAIATNLVRNELQKIGYSPIMFFQGFLHTKSRLILDELDRGSQPDEQLYRRELRNLVAGAIEKLPANLRLIFTLRESEGKSYDEIAEILGCNLGTVKSRLNRARKSFARIVEPFLDGQWE